MPDPRDLSRLAILVVATGLGALGCAPPDEPVDAVRVQLTAFCEAVVAGTGTVDVETDYIPHVIQCENGSADYEALAAQAIAARSVLYYKILRYGSIGDGTASQVYSCGRTPAAQHYRAASETAGQVLRYRGVQVYGFYVAGARQVPPGCTGGRDDPTGTERYVTYNEGRSGGELIQSPLGYVDPSNLANRGCMSQNGSHCLATAGLRRQQILRFYFGEDIEIERAEGACSPADPEDGGVTEADAGDSDAATALSDAGADDAGAPGGDGGPPTRPTPIDPTHGTAVYGSCAVGHGPARDARAPFALVFGFLVLGVAQRSARRRPRGRGHGP